MTILFAQISIPDRQWRAKILIWHIKTLKLNEAEIALNYLRSRYSFGVMLYFFRNSR